MSKILANRQLLKELIVGKKNIYRCMILKAKYNRLIPNSQLHVYDTHAWHGNTTSYSSCIVSNHALPRDQCHRHAVSVKGFVVYALIMSCGLQTQPVTGQAIHAMTTMEPAKLIVAIYQYT